MVLGDYYAARVRPTASSAPGTLVVPLSSPHSLSLSLSARLREFFFAFSTRTHTRTRTDTPLPSHRYAAAAAAPTGAQDRSLEQKAPKQNAIMISPEDGWSKLPRLAFLHREIDTLFESGPLPPLSPRSFFHLEGGGLDEGKGREEERKDESKGGEFNKGSKRENAGRNVPATLMRPRFKLVIPRKSH